MSKKEDKQDKQIDLNVMSQTVMRAYQDAMHSYLASKGAGELTDADVIVMIMNLTIGVATSIYYSLKQILPTTPMDYDFMRASICNSLKDSLGKIKDYSPKETMLPLTQEQVGEIKDNGFTVLKLADGHERKVTADEVMIKREDADKIMESSKPLSRKLILPNTDKKIILKN